MVTNVQEKAVQYMGNCRLCTLATVNSEGMPSAATVFFRNSGLDIYFNTGRQTQKVQNILINPNVAIVMQEAGPVPDSDRDIKGIQYTGKATVLSAEDTAEVPEPVMVRHKAFNSSGLGNSVIIKVTPVKIYLIDYSHGFRHRDLLKF
jgi:general stress protein 26